MESIGSLAVIANSFCKNEFLVSEALKLFPRARICRSPEVLSGQALVDAIGDAEVAIIGTEKISESVLEKCPKLKWISKYGVGLDSLNLQAMAAKGVGYTSAPGVNKTSVAEQTLGFMISLVRNLYPTSLDLKSGYWNKKGGRNLSGKTVGILGLGHVGQEVVRLLAPFHCQILANDILDRNEFCKENQIRFCPKDEIYSKSDVMTLHLPLTTETQHLIDARVFRQMNPQSVLINTSRGQVVDQNALKIALQEKQIAAAAIDVFETEPCLDLELLKLPNLFATPHIGGNSEESVRAMGLAALEGVTQYFYSNQ